MGEVVEFPAKVLDFLRAFDLARFLLVGEGRFVLVLHGVARRRFPDLPRGSQPHLTSGELRSILLWVTRRFALLTPEEFLCSAKRGVLLTFDDGFANNFANALPVLEQYEAPAVFFVSTQHVIDPGNWLPATRAMALKHWRDERDVPGAVAAELYDGLSIEQLALCASHPLITVGSHTVSHAFLTRCDRARLEHEVASSRCMLEEWTSKRIDLFAYPTGDYDRRVAEAVRAAGYRAAFAVDTRLCGLASFEIPRVGIYAAASSYLGAKLSGLHRPAVRRSYLAASGGPGTVD